METTEKNVMDFGARRAQEERVEPRTIVKLVRRFQYVVRNGTRRVARVALP